MNVTKVIESLRKSDLDKNTQLKIINSILNPSQDENKVLKQFQDRYELKTSTKSDESLSSQQFEILKNKLDMIQNEMADMMVHFKDYAQRYLTAMRQSDMDKLLSYVEELTEANKNLKEAQEVMSEEEKKMEAQQAEEDKGFFTRATEGVTNLLSGVKGGVQSLTGFVASTSQMANSALSTPIFQKNTSTQPTSNITINTPGKTNLISLEDYQTSTYGFQPINNNTANILPNSNISVNSNISPDISSNINSMVLSNVVIPPVVQSVIPSSNTSNIAMNTNQVASLMDNIQGMMNNQKNIETTTEINTNKKPVTPQDKVNVASQKLTTQIKKTENKPMVGGGKKITRSSIKNIGSKKYKTKKR